MTAPHQALPESALPTHAQRLLLKACLLEGAPAVCAWEEWSETVALDDVDAASQRLIPLLARNLRAAGISHPDVGRMRGIHRYWWSRNQVLLRKLPAVLGLLRAEGIEPLVLKGVPLALGYYEDAGLRPNVQTVTVADPAQDGLVIAQAPEQGSTAVAGDRVRINVGRFFGNTDTTPTETEPVTT